MWASNILRAHKLFLSFLPSLLFCSWWYNMFSEEDVILTSLSVTLMQKKWQVLSGSKSWLNRSKFSESIEWNVVTADELAQLFANTLRTSLEYAVFRLFVRILLAFFTLYKQDLYNTNSEFNSWGQDLMSAIAPITIIWQRRNVNWRNKQGCVVLCSLIEVTKCFKPHLYSRLYPHVTTCGLKCKPPDKISSYCRFIGGSISDQTFRPNSSHTLRFAFPDVSLPVTRNVYGYPKVNFCSSYYWWLWSYGNLVLIVASTVVASNIIYWTLIFPFSWVLIHQ
jgi:hypothetical protein